MTSPKTRIAYVSLNRFNTCLCDGVSNSTLDLLHFLKGEGHEVAVLTFFSETPNKRFSFEHLAAYNEPTLDPAFEDRLRCLSRKGFDYYFISNGTGVTEALVDFLIRERIRMSSFHINLPAIDPDE